MTDDGPSEEIVEALGRRMTTAERRLCEVAETLSRVGAGTLDDGAAVAQIARVVVGWHEETKADVAKWRRRSE